MMKGVAIVTGGTGGIGTAICQRLAADFQVVACYFKHGKHEEAKQWQEEQKKLGYDIDIVYGDIAQFADCEKIMALVMERYGRVDVLVNNAGVTQDCSLRKMTPEQWQCVIDANLTSVFNMTRNAIPLMLDKGYGRVISISSINGRKGQFGQCNYASTKSALYGFTKSLALEVANKGITVNTVSPGYIETPMLSSLKEEVLKSIISSIPVGRLGYPKEVADAVAFLASPDSGFITGANLDINGGQYM
ncbi:acetoacetyl-CoA reductase [Fluoribacter gormanii]|uniref:3-oxoacyl-[acyl-carrier-protein] reductase n=1 Tax=Fluoribacter gormanii TaxID=464 RepID=A0A377GFK6_9GAMM|nr:acetoacetyl-CoA reductase [Fluoribacter gormanii]KTD01589.1 3-oxoacyl-ACP reductase [Fluoribacter gormanii]MCW8444872.1 acetoacetyl-CoA reductase [Fluoribacter gormanii]MCW8470082.1 acetoacetyl-CoA reductase [Fluoribacter gormanii]SIR66808.1 3-oxoacyl-[acyl-carrier-protein] reductase [Fluoribacter gormanii]STO23561.1 3-oxoacyl-[acyl-carrier-protein] reductase FabG [Fluoribacter gormanii]